LVLPRRFRRELGNEGEFYILLGGNGEIWGFDPGNWSKMAEGILRFPLSGEEGRLKRLRLFPKAEECILDSQGRFILPQEFMEKLKFKEQVYIIGAGDHFEVWDINLWEKQQESLKKEDERIS